MYGPSVYPYARFCLGVIYKHTSDALHVNDYFGGGSPVYGPRLALI